MSRSIWVIVLHVLISLGIMLYALYVYIEKRVLITGKLTGHIYQLDYPANIIIAVSLLLTAIFVILVLVKNSAIKKLSPLILLLAIILFVTGVFV